VRPHDFNPGVAGSNHFAGSIFQGPIQQVKPCHRLVLACLGLSILWFSLLKISCCPFQGLTANFLLAGSSSSQYRGWAEHSLMLFELVQRFSMFNTKNDCARNRWGSRATWDSAPVCPQPEHKTCVRRAVTVGYLFRTDGTMTWPQCSLGLTGLRIVGACQTYLSTMIASPWRIVPPAITRA